MSARPVYVSKLRKVNGSDRLYVCDLHSTHLAGLHALAARIGLRRTAYLGPPRGVWPHYQLTSTQRDTALKLGAIEEPEA